MKFCSDYICQKKELKQTTQLLLGLCAMFFLACDSNVESEAPKIPNIILLIGDGMGVSQASSLYFFGDTVPSFERFPQTAFSKTSSFSHKITDSAAGATAFSIGKKTYNGAIGLNKDSLVEETILELMARNGWKTALVSSSSITHATPASFYAHQISRNMEEAIAYDMLTTQVDFFAGGGSQFFFNRIDNSSLFDSLSARNYIIDTLDWKHAPIDNFKKFAGLYAENGMPRMDEGRGDFLPFAANNALNYLENQDAPFFLMVEGSQIDWGGHANDGEYIVDEMRDFDKVIHLALDYAQKDGNTLVIVTADHETGGFTLASKEKLIPFRGKQRDYNDLRFGFSTGGHSSAMVPIFAFGPYSEKFHGVVENTFIYNVMLEASGLKP